MLSKPIKVLSTLALISVAGSTPTPCQSNSTYPDFVHPSNGICTDYTVKETITYADPKWIATRFANNYDVVSLIGDLSSKDGLSTPPFGAVMNTTKTFELTGTFCKPAVKKDGKESTVLVATHGLGFDRRYAPRREEYPNANWTYD